MSSSLFWRPSPEPHTWSPSESPLHGWLSDEASLPKSDPLDDGPVADSSSSGKSVVRLDDTFNFQIVVFQVENVLFQVLKNGFNVPETPFQGMFALPGPSSEYREGNSLDNPIFLEGVKTAHFRSFLRILYPFIGHVPVTKYDDWVGVLHLATMWFFTEIRSRAISALTELIKEKSILERIDLAREYHVSTWLQEAYVELVQKSPLTLMDLQPNDFALDWETIARIFYIRETTTIQWQREVYCDSCEQNFWNGKLCPCKTAQVVIKIKEIFQKEFAEMDVPDPCADPPLPLSPQPSTPLASATSAGKKKKKNMKKLSI